MRLIYEALVVSPGRNGQSCNSRLLLLSNILITAILSAVALVACSRSEEAAACLKSRDLAREAGQTGPLEEARSLLETARQKCGPSSDYDIQRIEEQIERRAELQRERERKQATRRAELERAPAEQFVEWVAEDRNAVTKNVTAVECAERGSPEFGFCEAHMPGSPEMRVRFWEGQKDAFRYSYSTEAKISCQDLGEYRRVKNWQRDDTKYSLCELTQHKLRSLSALLETSADKNQMFIFSQAYLQKDTAFRQLVEGP